MPVIRCRWRSSRSIRAVRRGLACRSLSTARSTSTSRAVAFLVMTDYGSGSGWEGVLSDYSGTSGNALSVTGGGMLWLTGNDTYSGSTTIANGTLGIEAEPGSGVTANELPVGTSVTLGDASGDSGVLQLWNNQEIAGLYTTGSGTGNAVIGSAATASALTVAVPLGSDDNFAVRWAAAAHTTTTWPWWRPAQGPLFSPGPTAIPAGPPFPAGFSRLRRWPLHCRCRAGLPSKAPPYWRFPAPAILPPCWVTVRT